MISLSGTLRLEDQGRKKLLSFSQNVQHQVKKWDKFDYRILIGEITRKKRLLMIQNLLVNKALQLLSDESETNFMRSKQNLSQFLAYLQGEISEETANVFHRSILAANMELGGVVKMPKKNFQKYIPYALGLFQKKRNWILQKKLGSIDSAIFGQIQSTLARKSIHIDSKESLIQLDSQTYFASIDGSTPEDVDIDEIFEMTPHELRQDGY